MDDLEELYQEATSGRLRHTKVCTQCGMDKPLELFHWASLTRADKAAGIRRKKAACGVCTNKESSAYRQSELEALREKDRARHYKKKYSIEASMSVILADARNRIGNCPICRQTKTLVVDHCHETGTVRDLICSACNSLLGYSSENLDTLYTAIEYLKKHRGL